MQATDRTRDRIKFQAIQAILALASMKQVTHPYQKPVTNIYANISLLCLSSSIMGIMTPIPQYSDKN